MSSRSTWPVPELQSYAHNGAGEKFLVPDGDELTEIAAEAAVTGEAGFFFLSCCACL
jgi:hypothetical protein